MKAFSLILLVLPVFSFIGCSGSNFVQVKTETSTNNLYETVNFLSSLEPPRAYYNKESLSNSIEYITKKFTEYGYAPTQQRFSVPHIISTLPDETYENIIAHAGPTNGEKIIVGAHYDVCYDQPGADDNASGIAGLLEVARFAKKHEKDLPYGVDFVAFCLEEPPYFGTTNMGSFAHAKMLREKKVKVRAMICFDMIGFFSDEKGSQKYPAPILSLFYPNKGNFIGVVGNFSSRPLVKFLEKCYEHTSLPVETISGPAFIPGVDFSDHRNYWSFGWKAVMITDTAFYRNPNYHGTEDTIEKLDFNRMKKVVDGVCLALMNF